jgi:hypothetical protein
LGGHLSAGGKGKADPEDLIDDLLSVLRPRGSRRRHTAAVTGLKDGNTAGAR